MRLTILLALALGAGVAAPAAAQSDTQINVPAAASWKHAGTGLILRSKIAGLPRGTITDSTKSELDMMVQYAEGEATAVTLYLYRPALFGVPVWFDRSETQILLRSEVFGTSVPAGPVRAFAGPRAATASALQRVYVPGRGPNKSTGLAIVPLGDWLVAVRISSSALDPAALEAKLGEVVAGIGWPEKIAEAPVATPIAPCTGTLAYDRKAKPRKMEAAQSLMGALILGAAESAVKRGEAREIPHAGWCREGAPTSQYGVYRTADMTNAYVLAIGDAGRIIDVGPAFALEKKDEGFSLSLGDLDRRLIYPTFDKLPSPEVAIDTVLHTRPVSSVSTSGKQVNIGM